jgi:hypothetical protein
LIDISAAPQGFPCLLQFPVSADETDGMKCLHCGKKLGVLRKLQTEAEFRAAWKNADVKLTIEDL